MADEKPLQKGVGTALLTALGMTLGGANHPATAPAQTALASLGEPPRRWSPEGLDPEMYPIAHLESSWGKNVNHVKSPLGDFHTAVGAVGLKPETAYDDYSKSKTLQAKHGGPLDREAFTKRMATDHGFYNNLASVHWAKLKAKHLTPEKAAYAWRWGSGAAAKTADSQIHADPYVQKFKALSAKGLAKAEYDLDSDIAKLIDSDFLDDKLLALKNPGFTSADMDHLMDNLRAHPGHAFESIDRVYSHPTFRSDHLHDLMDIQAHPNHAPTYVHHLRYMRRSPAWDELAVDKTLDRPHQWYHRPNELSMAIGDKSFKPGHLTRLLNIFSDYKKQRIQELGPEKAAVNYDNNTFADVPHLGGFMKNNPDINPGYLSNWLDWGLDPENRGVGGNRTLVQHLATHDLLSDKDFERLITSDHPTRTALAGKQMSDTQLKSFLSDPRFQDTTDKQYDYYGTRQSDAIQHQKRVSEANLDLASRSPHSGVRLSVARHPSTPPHLLEKLSTDPDSEVVINVAGNASTPSHVVDSLVAKAGAPEGGYASDEHYRNSMLRSYAAGNPKLSPASISNLIDTGGDSIQEKLASHPGLTQENKQKLAGSDNSLIVQKVLERKDLDPETVRTAFNATKLTPYTRSILQRDILQTPEYSKHLQPQDFLNLAHTAESNLPETNEIALTDPRLPQDFIDRHMDPTAPAWLRNTIIKNPKVGAEALTRFFADPDTFIDDGNGMMPGAVHALQNPNINVSHLAQVANHPWDRVVEAVAQHPKATPEILKGIYDKAINAPGGWEEGPLTLDARAALVKHANAHPDIVKTALSGALGVGAQANAISRPDVSDEDLRAIARQPMDQFDTQKNYVKEEAAKQLRNRSPDEHYLEHKQVGVKPGVGKLRRIRDLIWEKSPEKGEVHPKELPPGDWSAGRNARGNISGAKLQQVIDQTPDQKYNVSDSKWTGAQRHSNEVSQVLQVNLTNEHVRKMKEAGVYGTYKSMMDVSQQSGHPVRPGHTLGWVRFSGGEPSGGIQVDEIQSDFGQSFVRQARAQAAAQGLDPEEAGARAETKWPEAHHQVISNILFGGRHPNEVIGEAFMQHLRNKGLHGTPVHIHDAKTKAPLSQMDTDKELPGHMSFTYKELPKKMGFQPSSYGKLPTQSNPDLKGKPEWGDEVRKFESGFETCLNGWLDDLQALRKMAINPKDMKAVARYHSDVGDAVVDDHREPEAPHPHLAGAFKQLVVDNPKPVKRGKTGLRESSNSTGKVVYDTKDPVSGEPSRWLIKPYHEKINAHARSWQDHCIQGWAEMTTQALFHAGGIGHLHQRVHVARVPAHIGIKANSGPTAEAAALKSIPSLVIHMQPDVVTAENVKERLPDEIRAQSKKIALMDFLTGNLDRHTSNLLYDRSGKRLIAIDHSRSFAYKVPDKGWNLTGAQKASRLKRPLNDNLGNYIAGAHSRLDPKPNYMRPPLDEQHKYNDEWYPAFKWWEDNSPDIRKSMDKRLELIKDSRIREHVRRNFNRRARHLDEYQNLDHVNFGFSDWQDADVPILRYGHPEDNED